MKIESIIKRLGKKQRFLIKALLAEPLETSSAILLKHITEGLEVLELIEYTETHVHLSLLGREIAQIYRAELFEDVPADREEILNQLLKIKAEKPLKPKKREYLFLKFLSESPRKNEEIRGAKNITPALFEKNLIFESEGILSLTEAGETILSEYPKDYTVEKADEIFLASSKIEAKNALLAKAELFLSLYRQGFTYQEIGDLYELTRERVRQILNKTPNFELYLEEYEKAKADREREKKREARLKNIEKSLAAQFPDRVDELWDWEKNIDLNPAEIPAHSAGFEIWLKCPKDGHEWKKKPCDIVTSWERSKTSGCPVCAGKVNKPQKQKTLTEVFPEFVEKYWNYEKNSEEGLDPSGLTLGSNRKVWMKCPIDGNEWLAYVAATVKQQWSKGNAGCRVCNGTADRRGGKWGEAPPVAEKFPEQVAQYWDFQKNEEDSLNPEEITSGSSKEAWFKCPIDGFEWKAKIVSIGISWQGGNSGCPACRGFSATEINSLTAVYPQFIAEFWDFAKNKSTGLRPENLTCGTNREAWFKCPSDSSGWLSKINYIAKYFWKAGKSGCPKCGKGRAAIKISK
jgi:hypothetical protein